MVTYSTGVRLTIKGH